LKAYTDAFSPLIVGATGTRTQLTDMARRYRVAYRLGKPDANGDYAVYHSSAIFVFDGKGQARLLITGTETAPEIAADLEKLLAHP
jgi:protein SCO1/2